MLPNFPDFARRFQAGKPQVMWTNFVADLETPVSVLLKLADGRPNSFLLESVEGGAIRGRYSIVGLKPDLIWRCRGIQAEINRRARIDPTVFEPCPEGALDSLRALISDCRIEDLPPNLPPMAAGLVGYMAYDMVRLIEHLPDVNPDPIGVPDGMFLRPTIMAVFDNIEDTLAIVTPVWPDPGMTARVAYDRAAERLGDAVADLERPLAHRREPADTEDAPAEPRSNVTRERFHWMVEKAKEYIRAGDAFQVVPSQRFAIPFKLPPLALYRALRRLNPSPFLFFLDFGGFAIVGSSPEILVRVRDGKVTIRPLAGTRRRGKDAAEDRALAEELLSDPKELAEHLMLLDLGRNDVGRVARIGSVRVVEQFEIEYYSHVMHISSTVEGDIAEGCDAVTALMGGFPAGTVSGAPKVRAMEIIDEIETEKRGIYAGCIGYFAANGTMDTCIALRTGLVKDGILYVQAGGGVVADSVPETEYQESIDKARALMRAAEEAIRFAQRND
ncbi:MAG: anthranilate synthase component I [Alphaproteobacteria bacterium]|nr:anthranilate synthase component I [Alphaproteobacteria bacterium]